MWLRGMGICIFRGEVLIESRGEGVRYLNREDRCADGRSCVGVVCGLVLYEVSLYCCDFLMTLSLPVDWSGWESQS
jgi:hypothetical protein